MKISVALCTYNGEKYIEEQIFSIFNQSVPVDEIVVCDDGSTDNTLFILKNIANQAKINVRIFCNEQKLGVCENFQKAINLCHGDIILLSDQDDVWREDKVETIVHYFKQDEQKKVVFTDALLIDESGNHINNRTLWSCFGLTEKCIALIDNGLGVELFDYGNRSTGATMALRRDFEYVNNFSLYCSEYILHDGAISMLALNKNQLGYINECLVYYRIHVNQSCGVGNNISNPMSNDPRMISYLSTFWNQLAFPSPVNKRIAFIENRAIKQHKALGLFWMLGSISLYYRYYRQRWLSFLFYDMKNWIHTVWHYFFSYDKSC